MSVLLKLTAVVVTISVWGCWDGFLINHLVSWSTPDLISLLLFPKRPKEVLLELTGVIVCIFWIGFSVIVYIFWIGSSLLDQGILDTWTSGHAEHAENLVIIIIIIIIIIIMVRTWSSNWGWLSAMVGIRERQQNTWDSGYLMSSQSTRKGLYCDQFSIHCTSARFVNVKSCAGLAGAGCQVKFH